MGEWVNATSLPKRNQNAHLMQEEQHSCDGQHVLMSPKLSASSQWQKKPQQSQYIYVWQVLAPERSQKPRIDAREHLKARLFPSLSL
eukprot:1562651-Amphidinium_carterae.1